MDKRLGCKGFCRQLPSGPPMFFRWAMFCKRSTWPKAYGRPTLFGATTTPLGPLGPGWVGNFPRSASNSGGRHPWRQPRDGQSSCGSTNGCRGRKQSRSCAWRCQTPDGRRWPLGTEREIADIGAIAIVLLAVIAFAVIGSEGRALPSGADRARASAGDPRHPDRAVYPAGALRVWIARSAA